MTTILYFKRNISIILNQGSPLGIEITLYTFVEIKDLKDNNIWYKFNDRNYNIEKPQFNSKYVVGLFYIKEDFLLNSKDNFE